MAKRDIQRRERKKVKKGDGKAVPLSPIVANPPVEVVPKGKAGKEPKE